MAEFVLSQYGRQWSIFAPRSRCHVLFGTKKQMLRRLDQLNKEK